MASDLAVRATRGAVWLGLTNLATKGTQMVVTVVLAAALTQAELGQVTVAVALVNVVQVIQSMGVFDVVARTDRDVARLAGTVLSLSLAIATVITVTVLAGRDVIAGLLGAPEAAPLLAITALSLPFAAVGGVQMAIMHRTLDFRQRLIPDGGSALIGGAVTVALAVAGAGAYALAWGLLCTAILQPILGLLIGVHVWPKWDRGAATEALRWARVVGPAALIGVLLVNVDYPVVARVLGVDALGVYSIAFRIAWIPYIIGAIVLGAVAFPVYTTMVRDGRAAEIPRAVGLFTRSVVVLVGGMYLIIALLSSRIVVLDPRWEPAAPVLLVLCCYGVAISLLHTWYEPTMAIGQPRWFLILEVLRLLLLVAGLVTLTQFGVVAAATAQAVAAAVVVPLSWWAMRNAGCAPSVPELIRAVTGFVIPGAATVAVWLLVQHTGVAGPDDSLPGAIALGLGLLAVFGTLAALTNADTLAQLQSSRHKVGSS